MCNFFQNDNISHQMSRLKVRFPHESIVNSYETLASVEICEDETSGYKGLFYCPLCTESRRKPATKEQILKHIEAIHWKHRIQLKG